MKALFLVMMLMAPALCAAAELKDSSAALALADRAMQEAGRGDVGAALEVIRPYAVIPESEFSASKGQAELQLPIIASRFGKPIGYELVRNDTVGNSLVQAVYLQKFEKHAMVWRFIFYRNENGWTLNSFKFSDDLGTIL